MKYLPKFNEKKFEKKIFLEELRNILAVQNPVTNEEKRKTNSNLKSFEEITANYVITPDNFIKMVLILLRIRSNIPVIMMGETGCGKTFLIRKLSELKNNGNSKKMRILNIHAGTDDQDIINFIEKDAIPFAEELKYQNKKARKINQEKGILFEDQKLWVFLDEINTCKSMGLISELMCKHSYQGKKLPENIVFIAACNPYRKKDNKGKIQEKIGLDANLAVKEKKHLNEKERENLKNKDVDLVYLVNPLPHSLLNFVFDFGGLEKDDEESYIRCIIEESIEKIFYKREKENVKEDKKKNPVLNKIKQLAQDMVIASHKFIKKNNDRSVVSLREIRRFNVFYEFFFDYLQNRKKNLEEEKEKQIINKEEENFYLALDHYESQIYSINLSIFLCYYLRITEKSSRAEFVKEMNLIFIKPELKQKKDFLEIPRMEEQFLVNNIKFDKGIAKNRALLENIFSLFAALNTKVPIFIVGKPGCSKSLSFQSIYKSMQAGGSESTFFKKYPKLLITPYQGSMTSTSKGVEKAFEKARENYKSLNLQDKLTNISMIYFDEMGLAEHSPNNPLKVIHSKLEYDDNEGDNKIAFLGISNWALDAAKMNRGISIFIPDLNKEDNKETSLTIGKSYNEMIAVRYQELFNYLGLVYYEYKKYLKENYKSDGKQDFHGNRDFYHLIKIFARNLIDKEENNSLNEDTLIESAIDSIERNFGGMFFDNGKSSVQKFKEILAKKYTQINIKKDYDVVKRAKENLKDKDSRYLLVITKGSVNFFLISSILVENKNCSYYIGSKFKSDLGMEEYATKIMNKIQTDMENGNLIILKDLETIYPLMYDLFNQNFTILGNKKFARISVGSSTNAFSEVHQDFKCIVNVDTNKIAEEEPPFLNRFEKHIISFEDILSKDLIDLSKEIYSKLSDLSACDEELIINNYSLEKLLINCNLDEIQALIYQANSEKIKKTEDIFNYILSKISLTLPQDIIISMKYGKFLRNNPQYYDRIINYYKKGIHSNFASFLKSIVNNKNVVYTFSNKMEKINVPDESIIKKIIIGMLKKEKELENYLDDFFLNNKYKACLIQLMPHEGEFMNYIKYLIERKEKEYKDKTKKCFIFIIHMLRITKDEIKDLENENDKKYQETNNKILNETLSNLSGYYQVFIDNLNGDENLSIENIINNENKLQFVEAKIKEEFSQAIFTAISYIKYNITNSYKDLNKDNYIKELSDYILNNKNLQTLINECVFSEINKAEDSDIIVKILKNKNTKFSLEERDIASLIKQGFINLSRSTFYNLFVRLERNQFFSALLSDQFYKKTEKKETKKKEINIMEILISSYLESLDLTYTKFKVVEGFQKNKIDIILGFRYPGIKPVLKKIVLDIKENICKQYRENENNLRGLLDDEEKETKDYFNKLNIFDSSTMNIINNSLNIQSILDKQKNDKAFSEELFNLIKRDYFYNFLLNNINIKKKGKDGEPEEQIIYDFEDNIKFMDLIYTARNSSIIKYFKQNENDKNLDITSRLSKIFNFIESYSGEITRINQMFIKLSQQIPELYQQIEDIIKNKEIKFEISERNPEYSSVVNEAFFISVDSMIRVIISNEKIYDIKDDNPDDIIFDLISTYKEILQNALSLNNELYFRSKEAVSLQEILKLFDAYKNVQMLSIENIKNTLKYFKDETRYNNEGDKNKLCENFEGFCKFIMEKLENIENKKINLHKTLSSIFLNKYLKINDTDFRELLFKKILEKNELIINTSQLFNLIIENVVDIRASEMINNLDLIKEEESPIWKMVNNTENYILDEVLFNIIEGKVITFFDSIHELNQENLKELYPQYYKDNKNSKTRNETGIIFDNSFTIFKQVVEFLDEIKDEEKQLNEDNENIHLAKLYSLVYTKYYLYKLVYILKEHKKEIKNKEKIKEIMDFIKNLSNGFSKVLKIYIFKLFYDSMKNNFEEFRAFNFEESYIDFIGEFESGIDGENNYFLTYFFLPLDDDDYLKYSKEDDLIDKIKNNIKSARDELTKLIKEYDLDIFLTVSINKIISNLGIRTNIEDKNKYSEFFSYIKSLLDTNGLFKNNLKKLLSLFYDIDTFKNKTQKLLGFENGAVDHQTFEIILYGFRFCLNILDAEEKDGDYLYKSLLEKDKYSKVIEKTCIPGIDIKEDLHLVYLSDIDFHMKNLNNYGCYTCDCGYYYYIPPCGFPDEKTIANCIKCHKPIGYAPKKYPEEGGNKYHGMVIRDGHYRIFKDEMTKRAQMSQFGESDKNFPNMIYEDYLKKVIEPIKKRPSYGFSNIPRDFFQKQEKKIRNLSDIGYRLLNFISYSFLFFNFCLDNITKEEMKKYLIKDMDILQILKTDWNLLSGALKKKNINSTQIFLNMIFKKLSLKLRKCKYLINEEQREKFEEEIEKIISESISNYDSYRENYNKKNKEQLKVSNYSFKSILNELVEPNNEEIYPKDGYPYFKYFILTKYKTINDFLETMDSKDKYALTNLVLEKKEEFKKLEYLNDFNEFINSMLEEYSFKISREEAKKRILKDEKIYQNENFKNLFKKFEKGWEEIKNDAIKYGCRDEMKVITLTENDKLNYFLNDDGEMGGGMYIAAAYSKFIEWQNRILMPIIEVNSLGGILNNYVDFMKKKIRVQNASPGEIVLIDKKVRDSKYKDIKNIIYSFSKRNIFFGKDKINYSNYNMFDYDYDSIEEELGNIILPGVCQFESETELNFVVYWSEGFKGGNSDIISKFYLKYNQKDLNEEEKKKIKDYVFKINQENKKKYGINKDFKEIFGSLQILLFLLSETFILKAEEKIHKVIDNTSRYIKISDDCKKFFNNEGKEISISQFMNLYFIFEHLCFIDLSKTLQMDLKIKIDENIKNKICEKLLKNYNNEIYSLKDLCAALRRYISRYLIGFNQTIEIKDSRPLDFELSRQELWEKKIWEKSDAFDDILKIQLKEFKLEVKHAYEFYELIGEEDRKEIQFLNEVN